MSATERSVATAVLTGTHHSSFDPEANILIGRAENGSGRHISRVFQVAQWCKDRGIRLKVNSVINKYVALIAPSLPMASRSQLKSL